MQDHTNQTEDSRRDVAIENVILIEVTDRMTEESNRLYGFAQGASTAGGNLKEDADFALKWYTTI